MPLPIERKQTIPNCHTFLQNHFKRISNDTIVTIDLSALVSKQIYNLETVY